MHSSYDKIQIYTEGKNCMKGYIDVENPATCWA